MAQERAAQAASTASSSKLTPDEFMAQQGRSKESRPPAITRVADVKGEDSITGVAFLDGDLDAKGHTFQVLQKGEKRTLGDWHSGQHIRYDCRAESCLIENIDNSEVVHAKIIR